VFRRAITDMTASWIWELGNQAQNRIPDPIDYIEMRRKTFGSDLTMSLHPSSPAGIRQQPHRTWHICRPHHMHAALQVRRKLPRQGAPGSRPTGAGGRG
jgi:hypothetical protein